jgi:hypothetical protein
MQVNRGKAMTVLQGHHSLFDALFEFEQENNTQDEDFENQLLKSLMKVDEVEKDFTRLHFLIDWIT